MSGLRDPEQVCGFCALVIQLGYKSFTGEERQSIADHLRAHHGLKPYDIAP